MLKHQHGLSLAAVALVSAGLAALALAALFSMRYERNVFAEGWARMVRSAPARQAIDGARAAVAGGAAASGGGALRKCVIGGITVVSNTDCSANNPTAKTIAIHDSRGVEAPKAPRPPAASPTADPALDKMIEKQLH